DHLQASVVGHAVRGDVVEEEQGLGAAGEDIVDAVVDDVVAEGAVAAGDGGDLELRAHAIGAGNEDGLAITLEGEGAAERPDAGEDFGPGGAAGDGLEAIDEAVGGVDVDAGGGIGGGGSGSVGHGWAGWG